MRTLAVWLATIGGLLLCTAASPAGGGEKPALPSGARPLAIREGVARISRDAAGFGEIVFTRIPAARAAQGQRSAIPVARVPYGEGGELVVLGKDGSQRVLTPGFESAADPAVSFDGKRILFAGRRNARDHWDIFEMAADGSGVRQITRNAGNCRSPIYQSALFYLNDARPSYQLTFASDAAGELNESGASAKTDLFSARFDGSGLRRLTYALSASYDPFQMQDGRVLFAHWHAGRPQSGGAGRIDLFAMHLDGTDYAAFSGPQGLRIKHMACVTSEGQVIFVESGRPSPDGSGSLGALTLRRNLHSYRAVTGPADGYFYSPSPLADGSILVSRRSTAGGDYGIYALDPVSGLRALVFAEPGYHSIQAVALVQREEPDGHSSVVEDDQNWSKLYCLNVHENDLKREWMPPGTALRLRVIEAVPRRAGEERPAAPDPLASFRSGAIAAIASGPGKRLLGDLDLDDDGSFHLLVPPNTPIQLQIEDRDGLALRTSAWIWAKNKENRGCIGCHEDGERTPENVFAHALSHPAANLMLPPERRRTVDFLRDVEPILAAKCSSGACHGGSIQPALFGGSSGPERLRAARAYASLLAHAVSMLGNQAGYVDAGCARTSRLVWAILGRNTARPWDHMGPVPAVKPMPPAGSPPLGELERRAIIEWIDLGAQFDALPPGGEPAAGLAGGQP